MVYETASNKKQNLDYASKGMNNTRFIPCGVGNAGGGLRSIIHPQPRSQYPSLLRKSPGARWSIPRIHAYHKRFSFQSITKVCRAELVLNF